jgi:hypothetical protein
MPTNKAGADVSMLVERFHAEAEQFKRRTHQLRKDLVAQIPGAPPGDVTEAWNRWSNLQGVYNAVNTYHTPA